MGIQKKQLDYKWVILFICFFMEFICLGFCSSNNGLYLIAVTEALQIPRSLYSFTNSIRYIVQVVVAFYFGELIHRFGIKKLVCTGLCALISSVLITAYATKLYHIYISGALLGLGIVFVGSSMAGTIIRRWFKQDIGRYTGIVMSANGIGGALAAQIVSPIINNGNPFGYQSAYKLSALITLAISIVIVVFLKEKPCDMPVPSKAAKKQPRGTIWIGLDYADVKKRPYFYLSAIMVFLTGISLQSIGGITIAHLSDIGLDASVVATMATISSLTLTFSKFMVGYTYDKRGLRFTFIICHIATMIAFVLKATLTNTTLGVICAVLASCLTSLAMPLETVMIPLLSNDLFGSTAYHKVLGVFMAMNSLGLCLGSPLGNIYYDLFGTYVPCFWFFFALMVVIAIGWQFVIRSAYKDNAKLLASKTDKMQPSAE